MSGGRERGMRAAMPVHFFPSRTRKKIRFFHCLCVRAVVLKLGVEAVKKRTNKNTNWWSERGQNERAFRRPYNGWENARSVPVLIVRMFSNWKKKRKHV